MVKYLADFVGSAYLIKVRQQLYQLTSDTKGS